ncbi:MAG TPA: hypothetical protein VIV40_25840 [Kofleriaceae bacterium]
MTIRTGFLACSLPIILVAALVAADAPGATKRVTICHVPPGAPANVQTISIGEAALGAHLAHGDGVGACPTGCSSDAACDDGSPCTSDRCDAQGCHHEAVSCDDGNPCTLDACSPSTGCVTSPADGAVCDDGNDCTASDACVAGACHGTALAGCCATSADCDDGNACTIDSCAGGRCSNAPKSCAVADACIAGYCDALTGECGTSSVSCDDGDACTIDACDSSTGCTHQADPNCVPPDPGMD